MTWHMCEFALILASTVGMDVGKMVRALNRFGPKCPKLSLREQLNYRSALKSPMEIGWRDFHVIDGDRDGCQKILTQNVCTSFRLHKSRRL